MIQLFMIFHLYWTTEVQLWATLRTSWHPEKIQSRYFST